MRKYLLLNIFILVFFATYAQDSVIVLSNQNELKMIGKHVYFLEDKEGKLTLQDILKPENQTKLQKHPKDVFARSASHTAVWFKIVLQNQTSEDVWLEVGGSFACWYIDFYRPDDLGTYSQPVQTGVFRPQENKEYPVNAYWLKLAKAENKNTRIYYLRVTSGFAQEYPLRAGTLLALHKNKQGYDYLMAGFVGLMLIMALYNLFLFTATKDRIYLTYVGYLTTITLTIIFGNNYAWSSNSYWWKYYFVWRTIVFVFVGVFAIQYLDLAKNAPIIHKVVWSLVIIMAVIVPILNLAGIQGVDIANPFQLIVLAFYFILLSSGIYLWRKGLKNARFYVLGWSFAIISVFVFVFVINGRLPFNMFTRNALYFGFGMEVLMFSIALGDRLNIMRKEKAASQLALLQKSQENEKMVKEQNILLEHKVTERTQELTQINATLEATYTNLKQTTDRLNSSIQYAKNVQDVILPEDSTLRNFFNDYFALYLPKDIVAGDFYWFSQLDANRAIFVLADCTGHGVPGAFMTMVGNTLLHEIINVKNIHQPHLILPQLHSEITYLLKQDKGKNLDGMDLSICLLEKEINQTKVTFAGAKTKIYYVSKNELVEFAGDRELIGGGKIQIKKEFTPQTFYTHSGDIIYLASDGYADQNDKERKKFGLPKFKEMLLNISTKPFAEQQEILYQALQMHQGKEEQRDDITVVGLQL